MQVARPGERLGDQGRADHLAAPGDEAAVGGGGKQGLGEAGHRQGIGDAGQQGEAKRQGDRGAKMGEHGVPLQARFSATRARSMALIPTKGTIRPPSP